MLQYNGGGGAYDGLERQGGGRRQRGRRQRGGDEVGGRPRGGGDEWGGGYRGGQDGDGAYGGFQRGLQRGAAEPVCAWISGRCVDAATAAGAGGTCAREAPPDDEAPTSTDDQSDDEGKLLFAMYGVTSRAGGRNRGRLLEMVEALRQ